MAVAAHCGGDIAVTALAGEASGAAARTALATAGQIVVATPGRIAKVPLSSRGGLCAITDCTVVACC